MKDGTYEAKVIDYGIGETKDGTPQAKVMFQTEAGTITWFGIFNGGRAQEITIKALLTMGLKGNDLAPLAMGKASGILDMNTPVQIVVETEEYQGKAQQRVQWVNRLPSFRQGVNPAVASKVAGLKGAVAAVRHETGIKDPAVGNGVAPIGHPTPVTTPPDNFNAGF